MDLLIDRQCLTSLVPSPISIEIFERIAQSLRPMGNNDGVVS